LLRPIKHPALEWAAQLCVLHQQCGQQQTMHQIMTNLYSVKH